VRAGLALEQPTRLELGPLRSRLAPVKHDPVSRQPPKLCLMMFSAIEKLAARFCARPAAHAVNRALSKPVLVMGAWPRHDPAIDRRAGSEGSGKHHALDQSHRALDRHFWVRIALAALPVSHP